MHKAQHDAAFKAQAPHARIIHLATHGKADRENAWHSKIVLALGPQIDQKGEDGLLHTYEIFDLDLVADLVVLSACESGLGTFRPGEGLLGMSRAFLHSGAPSLVSTLWWVNDEATLKLMKKFYGYLAQGMNKRTVLQRAQVDLIHMGYGHPFYWASFALSGDAGPIKLEKSSPPWSMAMIFSIALFLFMAAALTLFRGSGVRGRGPDELDQRLN